MANICWREEECTFGVRLVNKTIVILNGREDNNKAVCKNGRRTIGIFWIFEY